MGLVKPKRETPAGVSRGGPHSRQQWPAVLEQVAAFGGEWARVAEYPNTQAASTTAGTVRAKYDPAGRFEFTSRKVGNKGVLYARLRMGAAK